MCIFKRKPDPDLIDLVQYDKELQRCISRNIPLMPVVPQTSRQLGYTKEEEGMMDDNRATARIIYDHYRKLSKRG